MSSATKSHVVPSTTKNVLFLQRNDTRQGAAVQNTSTAVLYLKFNGPASDTDHTVRMPSNSYYEVPFGFTGSIYGVWSAINGQATVTEIP